MQVDVHDVDAEVGGPHAPHDSVEVGAVAVEERAGAVHGVGNLANIPLEQATGVRVRQHECRDVGTELRLERRKVHPTRLVRGD